MKIRRIIINIIFILFFTLILSKNNTVFAAVSISASANKSSVNINETVAVSITATGGEGYVNISVQNGSADQSRVWASSQTTTVNCTASSNPGKMVINISGVIADSETNVDENVEYPPIEIEVVNPQPEQPATEPEQPEQPATAPEQPAQPTQEPEQPAITTKSSDASLQDFGIRPKEYDFTGFKPYIYEYSVEVPNDVTEVTVFATLPKGSKATATGAGRISLKEGENTAKVVVTAEDGKTTKEYTLTITRTPSEQPAENPTDTTEDPNATETPDNTETENIFGLESLSIKNFSISPKFSTDEYEYTVGVTEDLSSLEIEAKANKENATVEILGNENLQQGENTITILVTDQETEQTATYQIVVNKNSNAEVVAQVNWLDPSTWGTQQIIIVVVVIVLILVIVGVIIAKVKLAKRNVDEELEFPGADELDKAMAEHQELSDEESFPYKTAEGNSEFEKDFISNSNNSSNEEKYNSDSLFDNSTTNTENDNVTTNDYYNNHDVNMHTYDEKESKYHLFDDVPSTSNDNDLNDYDTSSRRKGKHF